MVSNQVRVEERYGAIQRMLGVLRGREKSREEYMIWQEASERQE